MQRPRHVCTECGLETVLKPEYPMPAGVRCTDGNVRCLGCRYQWRCQIFIHKITKDEVKSLHKVKMGFTRIRRQLVRAIEKERNRRGE